jgi:hypothetical protein
MVTKLQGEGSALLLQGKIGEEADGDDEGVL